MEETCKNGCDSSELYTITDPEGSSWKCCRDCWDNTMAAAAVRMIRTGQFR